MTRLNIKKFCVVLALRLCVLYGSQNKQQLLPYRTLRDCLFITEVESVYSAVRTEPLCFVFKVLSWSYDGRFHYFGKYVIGGVPQHIDVTEYVRFVIDSVTG
jgi:hypothetical protein